MNCSGYVKWQDLLLSFILIQMFLVIYLITLLFILSGKEGKQGGFCQEVEVDCWGCFTEVNNYKSSMQGIL
jgi:hypothetical protein